MPPLVEDELELLLDEELELLLELEELLELLEDELLLEPLPPGTSTVQDGSLKLPS